MPRRWMSLRAGKRSDDHQEKDTSNGLNLIAAPLEPLQHIHTFIADSPTLGYDPALMRPRTSICVSSRSSALTADLPTRPRTSDGMSPALKSLNPDDSKWQTPGAPSPRSKESRPPPLKTRYTHATPELIGVAFGSPTHPPTQFFGAIDQVSPQDIDHHAFERCGPFPDDSYLKTKRKWKAFGGLFKQRPQPKPREPQREVHSDGPPAVSHPPRTSSRNPVTTPSEQHEEPTLHQKLQLTPLIQEELVEDESTHSTHSLPQPSLPKLQVEIPSPKLDRYTVMFEKVVTSQSGLAARRSRVLDKLNTESTIKPETEDLPASDDLHHQPRQNSTSKRQSATWSIFPTTPELPKASAGFSLFPNTLTTSLRSNKMQRTASSPLKRAVTSPARLSPLQDSFEVEKPQPLKVRKNSDKWVTSPEQNTAPPAHTQIWSAGTHLTTGSADTSLDGDILFDIKSVRDSSGEGAFEMARPTSNAVALYRSMSHNLKAKAPKPSLSATISTRDSIAVAGEFQAIDEAIAAVEKMSQTSPPRQVTGTSKSHLVQLVGDPSTSKDSSRLGMQSPTPIEDDQDEAPPPVPVKDIKVIPVSKFAMKPGSKVARPLRSATEHVAVNRRGSPVPVGRTGGSRSDDSLPGRSAQAIPKSKAVLHKDQPQAKPVQHRTTPVTPVPAIVLPVAEVSVARTISLARKQSQRVLVSGRKAGDQRAGPSSAEETATEEKRKTKIELMETRPFVPLIVEGAQGHRPGKSVNALIECLQ